MKKLFLILLCSMNAWAADDLATALKSTDVIGYVKAMYVYDDRQGGKPDQSTPGFGGKIGLETGSFHGFKARAAWYATTDLGLRDTNPQKTDAFMFDLDKNPYSILGEAALLYTTGKNSFTLGRQEMDTPMISTYDYRIIPNLFEAYTLVNTDLDNTTLTLSYVTNMAGLDGLVSFSQFKSMSQQAYTSLMLSSDQQTVNTSGSPLDISKTVGDKGVFMAGMAYKKNHTLQVWNYYCPEVLNTFYLDASYKQDINSNLQLALDVQGYTFNEIGKYKELLEHLGLNGTYQLFGLRSSLASKDSGLSASVAYNKFTGNSKTVTVFGNWGGYPEFVSIPYIFPQDNLVNAIARSQMIRFEFKADLSKLGLNRQTFVVAYTDFDMDESILKNSDILITDLSYEYKIMEKLSAKISGQLRDSKNYRYDNDTLTISLRYDF